MRGNAWWIIIWTFVAVFLIAYAAFEHPPRDAMTLAAALIALACSMIVFNAFRLAFA